MKFKKHEDYKRITIKDTYGDNLYVDTGAEGFTGLWFTAEADDTLFHSGASVRVTRAKALKLAWAIINELDPV